MHCTYPLIKLTWQMWFIYARLQPCINFPSLTQFIPINTVALSQTLWGGDVHVSELQLAAAKY